MSENRDDVPLNALSKPSKNGYSPLSSDGASDDEMETKGLDEDLDEDLEESEDRKDDDKRSSSTYTLMFIIRTFVGTGILAMPYAFRNLGLILGFTGIIVCWMIMTYSLYLLVECAVVIERKCKKKDLGFGEVMEEATRMGPKCFQKCVATGRNIVNGLVVSMQFGCCCVYIVFIADNLKEVFNEEFDINWPNKRYICIMSPIFLLLASIRQINILAKFAVFGNLVFMAGFVIIMQHVAHDFIPLKELPWVVEAKDWPRGFATAVFAFEGICLVLPLRSKMRNQEDYMGCNGVLLTSMYLVLILYECLGFYGYLRFGAHVHATISVDLPHEPLYIALKILFPLVIFVSYAVQYFVIVDIVYLHPDNGLISKVASNGRSTLLWEYVFRISISILTIIFALVVPMLGSLMELVGALLGMTLSVTLPHAIVLLVRYSENDMGCCKWRIPFHMLFIIFGLFMAGIGTFTTVQDVIEAYNNPIDMQFNQLGSPSPTTAQ